MPTKVGEICEFKYGKSLPAKDRVKGHAEVYGSNGVVGSHTHGFTQGSTIVIGRKGSVGEVAYSEASCWPIDTTYFIDQTATDTHLRWLFYALQSLGMERMNKAAAVPGLNRNDVYALNLHVPPIEEQRRIAAILDKSDAIRRKRQQALALADDFLRSTFLEMFGDPVVNPKGLPVAALGDVSRIVSGGTPSKSEPRYWNGDFPWVSPKDMKHDLIESAEDGVTKDVFIETSLKKIQKQNVLIVVRGMILAHTVPVAITATEVAINQDIKAISWDERLLPDFALWCMKVQHKYMLSKVGTAAHGTKRLDTEQLRQFPILLPDQNQQRKFVTVQEKFLDYKAKLSEQGQCIEMMFASLSGRAFRGDL